jgi:outer membrane protein TolC
LALQNNVKAQIAKEQVNKIKYEKRSYFANFFPKASLQGMYLMTTASTNYNTRIDMYNTALPSLLSGVSLPAWVTPYLDGIYQALGVDIDLNIKYNNSFFAGVQIQQPIFWGGKIVTAYKMAKTGTRLAELNTELTAQQIEYQIEEAYWQLVKVINLQQVALQYKSTVENVLKDAQNGIETGMISANDKLKAEIKLGEATLLAQQTQNGLKLAQMNLCMLTGMDLLTLLQPTDSVSEHFPVELLGTQISVNQRVEYEMLQKQLALKKQQINLVRSDYLPQIGVVGGYQYMNGILLNDEKLFNSGSFSAVISLNIPITQWGEGAQKIRAAQAEYKMAEAQTEDNIRLLTLEIVQLQNKLDEAILKVKNAQKEVEQTSDNVRIMTDKYELGFETLSALLEAQTLRQQALSKLVETKIEMKLAETNLKRVIR